MLICHNAVLRRRAKWPYSRACVANAMRCKCNTLKMQTETDIKNAIDKDSGAVFVVLGQELFIMDREWHVRQGAA
jgi:hypothetical protein